MAWYTGDIVYDTTLLIAFGFCILVALGSLFMDGPYGRFSSSKYGFTVNPKLGWFLMELPATFSFLYFFFRGNNSFDIVPLIFLGMWLIHYGNRGFVFPLLMRAPKGTASGFSILVIVLGALVTTVHGYLNATFITKLGEHIGDAWLSDPRFIIGIGVYYIGFFINIHSDSIIRNLRTKEEIESGKKVYRIPEGGLFSLVSCPSYLSELIGWVGFAIATWSRAKATTFFLPWVKVVPMANVPANPTSPSLTKTPSLTPTPASSVVVVAEVVWLVVVATVV